MISPLAYVNPEARIGENVTIHPFAYIDKEVEIGDNCEIMPYASILSGTHMGKNNRIFQQAVLGAEPQDFKYKGDKSSLIIGDNNTIRENVVINRATTSEGQTKIGDFNFIHEGVHISHDTEIGNHNVFGYGTKLSGNCMVQDCAIFGGGILMSQGCRVGSWTMIETGCRFKKDIPPYIIAAKEPITYYGVNAYILEHEKFSEKIIKHISHAYRIIYQGNCSLFDALFMIKDQVPMSEEIENIIQFAKQSKRGLI